MDIMKMLGVDPNLVKQIGEGYEKRLQRLEELNDYQADLLEKLCVKFEIDYQEEPKDE